ncbi:Esterase 6 [Orchesella cincta]|uniref:Esterase 6 n=1 Tax=Orchesella cincta TaxID=48709 RepID=A0A1D2N7R0_ORCCI|nr:Esterase 6 [Orchesella cincta]
MGHSSGAAAAHLHLIANKTTPYFQSGASFSGSAFTHWAIQSPKEAKRLTDALAYNVNCNNNNDDSEALVECLRQKNPVELVSAQYRLLEFAPFPVTLFTPVIEKPDFAAYLTKRPDTAYALGQVDSKPWMFTTTSQEGYLGILFLQSFFTEGILRSKWDELAPIFLDYKYTANNVTETTEKISRFYFGSNSPLTVSQSRIAAAFGDRLFMPGIHQAIKTHATIAPTYAYVFGFKGKYSLGSLVGRLPSEWGTQHQDDIMYFLNSSIYYPGFKRQDVDEHTLSNVMTSVITNFAAKGEPLLTQPNKVNVRIWDPVDPTNIHYLLLNRDIRMIPEPYKKRINFWLYLGQTDPSLINPLYDII